MKRKILLLMVAMIGIMCLVKAQHTYSVNNVKSDADKAWGNLPVRPIVQKASTTKEQRAKGYADDFKWQQDFRDKGLKFWYQFPNDSRRYQWLLKTMLAGCRYYLDADQAGKLKANSELTMLKARDFSVPDMPVDLKLLKQWEEIYPKLRKEFLSADIKRDGYFHTVDPKMALLYAEFTSFLHNHENPYAREFKKMNLKELNRLFTQATELYYGDGYIVKSFPRNPKVTSGNDPLTTMSRLFFAAQYFGLTSEDLRTFIISFKSSKIPQIQNWATQSDQLLSHLLDRKPFEFKFKSENGKEYDLEQLKGKVVFLDMWATTCGTCIAAMPELKRVYKKYKNQGFEVLSIAIDPESQREQLQKIHERVGADWPMFIIGGKDWNDENSLSKKYWDKYGFKSVPQLLLIDKDGQVVEYMNVLYCGDYEPLVKELLKKPMSNNKS